jgi:hypothetical protein
MESMNTEAAKLQEQLRDIDADIEKLKVKSNLPGFTLGLQYENQLNSLTSKRAAVLKRIQELQGKGGTPGIKPAAVLTEAWERVKSAVKRVFSRTK